MSIYMFVSYFVNLYRTIIKCASLMQALVKCFILHRTIHLYMLKGGRKSGFHHFCENLRF